MKKFWKHVLLTGLPVLMMLSAGCGSSTQTSSAAGTAEAETAQPAGGSSAAQTESAAPETAGTAGKYTAQGLVRDDYVITTDSLEGYYLELEEGGSGYLYFGEDNKGPITSWEENSGTFTMKAGVSDFKGTLKDGLLSLDLGDNLVICFAAEGTDTSGLNRITAEEYKALGTAKSDVTPEQGAANAGKYIIYAVESGDKCVLIGEEDKDAFVVTLKEDGTGLISVEDESQEILWKLPGEALTLYETTGELATDKYEITLKNGIMTVLVPGTNGDPDIIEYLVTADADVSEIDKKVAAAG